MNTRITLIQFDVLESTNNTLSKLSLQDGFEEFTTICTRYQSAGKGQRGNTWESDSNQNCLFSTVLYPQHIPANKQFLLSQITSLALSNVLLEYCNGVRIKWPNDIYVNNKKIAGILIENVLAQSTIDTSIIGIGLNCNQTKFPPHLPQATSLAIESGRTYSIEDIITKCVLEIKKLYSSNIAPETIHTNYTNQLYLLNKMANYKDANGEYSGKIVGVEPDGALIIQDEKFAERRYYFKEVEYL